MLLDVRTKTSGTVLVMCMLGRSISLVKTASRLRLARAAAVSFRQRPTDDPEQL
jgi:hypothetical protein